MIFLFAFALLAVAPASLAEDTPLRLAIIKADDMRDRTATWDRFFALSRNKGVKVSVGIVCNSLEDQKVDYIDWLNQLQSSGWVEYWNHGWDHKRWETDDDKQIREFAGTGYTHQKKHFEDSQELMKNLLGVAAAAFGPPYNAFDADTVKVMQENDDVRLLFTYKLVEIDNMVLAPMRFRGEHDGTGKPNYDKFRAEYQEKQDVTFSSIQFHPNHFGDEHFEEYTRILDFLIAEGWTFVLPADYISSIHQKAMK